MHANPALVLARIDRFVAERIVPAIYAEERPVEVTAWEVPDEPVPFADAVEQHYAPLTLGSAWGKPWGTTWFRVAGEVPPEFTAAGSAAELVVDLGFTLGLPGFQAEGLVWRPDGTTVKALEPLNSYVPLRESGPFEFFIEAASNPDVGSNWTFRPTPLGDKATAGTEPLYVLRRVSVARRDVEVWELQQDFWTLRGLVDQLQPDSSRAAEIRWAMERAVDVMDPHDIAGTAAAGRQVLAGALDRPANASAHRITAVGHAHIDSAWLWPTRETVRKCARTFSNALQLMDDDPDFVFACSSAQQYAWIEESYPELFERIRARVSEGRFVPVGGMWVESDTNLPGGESLVRQLAEGQRYFESRFGRRCTVGWLPDSFGYTGALPQLLSQAGITYFLTQKISWNETNVFPHHTFQWEGIDGTRMFTHFPPVDSYNAQLSGAELRRAERQFAEKGPANSSLVPFGFGDGGGGPTREMLAAAKHTASLEGSPTVRIADPARFFADARAEYPNPPVWVGELYLEFHRGTYTSQARTKRGNRVCERMLHEAELWAATASVRTGADYPYDELREIWRLVLLQQFHDILPGTSIAWVHQEAECNYAAIEARLASLISAAQAALARASETTDGGATGETQPPAPLAFNPAPIEQDGIPAFGAGSPRVDDAVSVERRDGTIILRNASATFVIDETGRISSAVDSASGREAIAPGRAAAALQLFRDTPRKWDAWDIDAEYRRSGVDITDLDDVSIVDDSAQRAIVRVRRRFGASAVEQDFILDAGSPSLVIETRLDWRERQKLLKLAFPLDVTARFAASEVQFGHVFRPTHENTSWDAAQFETCAHRWLHVGEPGYGVAVANTNSYGHDITREPRGANGAAGGSITVVRQSLVRAPLFPDPHADQGAHTFRSSLTPGAGIPEAIRAGYRLNLPLQPVEPAASDTEAAAPLVSVSSDSDGVIIETVKLADDRSGDVIVRLYEALGTRTRARLAVDAALGSIRVTDLLETGDGAEVEADGSIEFGPFQVVTLRVKRR